MVGDDVVIFIYFIRCVCIGVYRLNCFEVNVMGVNDFEKIRVVMWLCEVVVRFVIVDLGYGFDRVVVSMGCWGVCDVWVVWIVLEKLFGKGFFVEWRLDGV